MRRKLIGVVATAVALAAAWPAAASTATPWVRQPTPLPPGAMFGETTAVSCAGVRACTAVGFANNQVHSSRRLLAEQWSGGAWAVKAVPGPAGLTGGVLGAVSCVSPARCTAVGEYGGSGPESSSLTLAETWNGSAWAPQSIPNPAGAIGSLLLGVSCTSAVSCTAVGSTEGSAGVTPLAEHWNGQAWAIQDIPGPAAGALNGVSCTAPGFGCIAVGNVGTAPLAEQWNGREWTILPISPLGRNAVLDSVSCRSVASCEAVGSHLVGGKSQPLAASWDGTAWSEQPVPAPSGSFALNGVSCIAATQCTAVGGGDGLAVVWNGTDWTTQATANPTPNKVFDGISCTGPGTCTAVGDSSRSLSGHETLPLTEHE